MTPRIKLWTILLSLVIIILFSTQCFAGKTVYVNQSSGADTYDGLNWETAKKSISSAIDASESGDEIWVAAGIYGKVTLKAGVAMYGGFNGSETDRSQRDRLANVTTIDSNKSTAVTISDTTAGLTTIVDGFRMINSTSAISASSASPTIANNAIIGCGITTKGGQITGNSVSGSSTVGISGGSANVTNNHVFNNVSGGITSSGTVSDNVVERNNGYGISCRGIAVRNIIRNNADFGLCMSSAVAVNNFIIGNGGGVYCSGTLPSIVTNNTIVGNMGPTGAVYIQGATYATSKATIANNIIAFNYAGISRIDKCDIVLRNNCVYNPGGVNYVDISAGTGDISVDPKFISAEYGRVHIKADSPCIDAGSDADVVAGWTDIDGQTRILGTRVDIGADEFAGDVWNADPVTIRVSPFGSDSADGSSWSLAKKTIQAAVDAASVEGGEVWTAAGTYKEQVTLRTFVGLYGGFSGNENTRDQRDWKQNATVIDATGLGFPQNINAVTAKFTFSYSGIDGFTIRNSGSNGIGCICSMPRIINNVITGTRTGIFADPWSNPAINNCRITGNTGDGINCDNATIANNVILGNGGRGIACFAAATITNNTIVGHTSNDGIGISVADAASVSNNVVAFNAFGILKSGSASLTLRNNCVYNPDGIDYSGVTAGTSDISANPGFAALKLGDIHIQPGSPCIDAGIDADVIPGLPDMDGQPRIAESHVDIGADESDGTTWQVEPLVIRVSPSGDDTNDGGSWSSAKKTIQAGIDAASVIGGEVWVAAGNYKERLNLKPFVYLYGGFAGTEDTKDARDWKVNKTIVGASVSANACQVKANFGSGFGAIDGFTICDQSTKPSPYLTGGGGIYCGAGCSIAIENNVITNNYGSYNGIYFADASPLISNNIIKDNQNLTGSSYKGAITGNGSAKIVHNVITGNTVSGVQISGHTPVISGNYICRNRTGGIGSGAYSPVITNNIIGENDNYGISLSQGYQVAPTDIPLVCNNVIRGHNMGVGYDGATVSLINNTIVANITGLSGDNSQSLIANNIIAFGTLGLRYTSGVGQSVFRTNCVYNPDGNNYGNSTSPSVNPGIGDINVDPKLAGLQYGRMHVQPDSPCINAGTDTDARTEWRDMDGQPRFQGSHIDIGADESDMVTWWNSDPVIVRVSTAGDDANDGSNWNNTKKTVQAAIDAVSESGGEIWVKAGTYYERINIPEYCYLYGGFTGSETNRDQRNWKSNVTTLDGSGGGRIVKMTLGTHYSAIDGFTIRNGAGIYCQYTSPSIVNNTITGNNAALETSTASALGGGIYCSYAFPTIQNCTITKNAARIGAGVYGLEGGPILESNVISDNAASVDGGGVYLSGMVSGKAIGNVISRNTATGKGGGIYTSSMAQIVNNTIAQNQSASGGGIYLTSSPTISGNIVAFNSSGVFWSDPGVFGTVSYNYTPTLTNNNFYNPDGYNYSGVIAGVGDISVDPLFVDKDHCNYHITINSPCIDNGSNSAIGIPTLDMDGQTRINGGTIDIGADEYWPVITDAKKTLEGMSIGLSGPVVTASFPDFLYVESLDRSSGIRVDKQNHGLMIGARVDVDGILQTNSDGEYCVAASSIKQIGTGSITPITFNNSWLGGGSIGYQVGVSGGIGLNNIGLLIKTTGRVITAQTSTDSFIIDDGSNIGIKCIVPSGVVIDTNWSYVCVTGICSCEKVSVDGRDELRPVIRVRTQGDIASVQE